MKRREFVSKVAVGGSILFVSPFYLNSCSKGGDSATDSPDTGNTDPITIDLSTSDFSDLNTVGGYVYYDKYIIIRSGESEYHVLAKLCTHKGAWLDYVASSNSLVCNEHGAMFSIAGVVLNGPATRNLAAYNISVSDNIMTIG